FFSTTHPPPRPTLFPYTTLFRSSRGKKSVQSGRVSSMDDGGPQPSAQPVEQHARLPNSDTRAIESVDVDVAAAQPQSEVRIIIDAGDCMTVARFRQSVDEIDEPVLHSTNDQVMDNMQYERAGIVRRRVARPEPRVIFVA